jgi:hypothetical protein
MTTWEPTRWEDDLETEALARRLRVLQPGGSAEADLVAFVEAQRKTDWPWGSSLF